MVPSSSLTRTLSASLLLASPLLAEGGAEVVALAVEIVDDSGRPAGGLGVEELLVVDDGSAAEVLALDPAPPGAWQITVYFDARLSEDVSLQRVARVLSERIDTLARLGEVELVVARPDPRTFLPATDRRELLEEALARLHLQTVSDDEVRRRRAAFLELRHGRPQDVELVLETLALEIEALREQQDRLIGWLADRGRTSRPRLLLLVNDALGLDPLQFYLGHEPRAADLAAEAEAAAPAAELGEALAAYGWVAVPMTLPPASPESALQYRPSADLPVGFRLGIGGSRRDAAEETEAGEEAQRLGLEAIPRQTLERLAATTGGVAVDELEGLESLLERLGHRSILRYRPTRAPAGTLRALAVGSQRSGRSVRAPAVVAIGTPPVVAEVRLRRALAGELDDGELTVASTLRFDPLLAGRRPASLETQADLSGVEVDLEGEGGARFRVSVAVHLGDGGLGLRHEVVEDPALVEADLQWRHESSLMVPAQTDAAAVLVEHLPSGEWGLVLPEFVDRRFPDDLPEPVRLIQILPPEKGDLRRGKVQLHVVTEPQVRRVEYWVNGDRTAGKNRAPFSAKIELGTAPSSEVVAVAYDREGVELDRDRLILNEAAESFWVRLVEPAPGPRAGPVDVEASLKLPEGGRLDRLEIYLTERLVASFTEPPYRRRIHIPVSSHGGFLRAAAYLRDGTVAEDVVLLNRPGFGEEMSVELVELYVVANDRQGKPVQDLEVNDFTVIEDDLEQQLESFSAGRDLPLTLGLAIDSSSSLFFRLPEVQTAAKGFVRGLIQERDRAFLVGFGMSPKLVRPVTADLRNIVTGISSLTPYGTTPVWEAIVLSLTQLQREDGRRALVVFYDGDDEDQDFSYRTCLALAQRMRLPIYMIVLNNAAARSEGRSFSSRAFVGRLEKLADAGGGRVYYVRTDEDLGAIFGSIGEELRSHYLLTYYPRRTPGGPQWRPVVVRVNRRGYEARTLSGYGPPGSELGD